MGFDKQERCMGCMGPLAWDGRCSCGFDKNSYPADSHYLPLGSLLKNGDYVVGKVLGEGGFGITYIGFDQNLLSRVAIKEYYPSGFAGRDVSNGNYSVCPYGGDAGEVYEKGLDAFLREATILAQFNKMEGIVKVRCSFQENQTAYIVMEYVEGISVKNRVLTHGRIPPEMVWKMMEQPIRALQAVHEKHLVHRDVSADNLMIERDGKIILIDFGSARSSNVIDEKTRTMICKQGFSALEQYSKDGKQGPWTDVYGICATMYYMLTGIVPENSTERIVDDMVVPLNRMGDIALAPEKKDALMTGMAVKRDERFRNMEALYSALYGKEFKKSDGSGFVFRKEDTDVSAKKEIPNQKMQKQKRKDKKAELTALLKDALQKKKQQRDRDRRRKFYEKAVGGIFAVIVLMLIFWGMRGYIRINAGVGNHSGQMGKGGFAPSVGKKVDSTPKASGELSDYSVKTTLEKGQASGGPQTSDMPPEGSTNIPQAGEVPQGSSTSMPQSGSSPQGTATKTVQMPKVAGLKKANAVQRIKKKGLRCRVVSRNHNSVAAGTVIRASIAAGKTVEKGKKITLYVSKGKKVAATPKPTVAPRQTPPPPAATRKPTVTKKPNQNKDDGMAGDLDDILY